MKQVVLTLTIIALILPFFGLAQSDGSISPETPIPTEAPLQPETPLPTATPDSGASVTPTSASVQATSIPREAAPLVSVTPSPTIKTVPDIAPISSPVSLAELIGDNADGMSIIITLVASALAMAGLAVYKAKTDSKKNEGRCDNIRDLLEQKKKELEEMVRNWPVDKIKELAQDKITGELKKNEDVGKILDTAEDLKAKHDKLRETIELLQKRYDICMLGLPSLNGMKTLRFKGFKAKAISEGIKTATIRLLDDKDLKAGDELRLLNSDDGKSFAEAEVTEVVEKKLGDIETIDLDGHEKWNNKEEMLASLKQYYGDGINFDTIAKIVRFKTK